MTDSIKQDLQRLFDQHGKSPTSSEIDFDQRKYPFWTAARTLQDIFQEAAASGDAAALKKFIQAERALNRSENNNPSIIATLQSGLDGATRAGHTQSAKLIIDELFSGRHDRKIVLEATYTAGITWAAIYNRPDILRYILQHDVDLHDWGSAGSIGYETLNYAAKNGAFEIVNILLEHGVLPYRDWAEEQQHTQYGYPLTPLRCAAVTQQDVTFQILKTWLTNHGLYDRIADDMKKEWRGKKFDPLAGPW